MPYDLQFKTEALKEWDKLGATVRAQFKNKLAERLNAPHVPAARLSGNVARYKIKRAASGFRLVYEVRDAELVVVVIAVGKRERGRVYRKAQQRYRRLAASGSVQRGLELLDYIDQAENSH